MKDLENRTAADQIALEIVDASPAAVLLIDEFGQIIFANRKVESVFGYQVMDLLGQSLDRVIPNLMGRDHLAHSARFTAQPTARQRNDERILYGIHENGTRVPVEISLQSIQADENALVIVHISDASCKEDLKSVQREAMRGAQQRLLESERLDAIGEMVTGLAHESRNAIQRALSSLDLLELDLQAQNEQLDLVQRVKHALTDLNDVYEEVRHYASPITIRPQKVDLRQLCFECFDEIAEQFPPDTHWLRLNTDEPCTARVDPLRMKQVIKQVFNNAIAASDGPADIQVSINQSSDGWVKLTISDAGCGIAEAEIRKAFAPFFTTKQHGTGLGLAVCRRILEAHDGDIQLANNKRTGVTVTVALPVTPMNNSK